MTKEIVCEGSCSPNVAAYDQMVRRFVAQRRMAMLPDVGLIVHTVHEAAHSRWICTQCHTARTF